MRDYARILVQGFACNYARVGFLQAGNLGGRTKPRWPEFELMSDYNDHAIAHKFNGEDGAGSDGLSRAVALRDCINLQTAYNTLFAETLDLLAATPDADGSRMLDNTLVVFIRQMGVNHNDRRLLWLLAGGANLGVRGGRYRRLNLDSPYRFVNDLHVTLAHKMGVTDVESFGYEEQNRSPLSLG